MDVTTTGGVRVGQDDSDSDDAFVFDDAWAARGVRETSMRRHLSPPPPSARDGAERMPPQGPRDWAPRGPHNRGGDGRRRNWIVALVSMAIAVAAVAFATLHHSGGRAAIAHVPSVSASTPSAAPSATDTAPTVKGIDANTSVGHCFDLVDGRKTTTAVARDCSAEHTDELIAFERASGADNRYPTDSYWDGPVQARCTADLVRYTGQPEQNWPPTLHASMLRPRVNGWAAGQRTVWCLGERNPGHSGALTHLAAYRSAIPSSAPPSSTVAAPVPDVTGSDVTGSDVPGSDVPGAITLTGRLQVATQGQNVCLVLHQRSGGTVAVRPDGPDYSWLAEVDGLGRPDNARSGIARGMQPAVGNLVKHAGTGATLTGRYSTPNTLGCGGEREFDFAGFR